MKDRVNLHGRVAGNAAIFTAAVLEYLCAEVLELAGNTARDLKVKRINPRHIQLAVRQDDELDLMMNTTVIAGGGVVPSINRKLITKEDESKQSTQYGRGDRRFHE